MKSTVSYFLLAIFLFNTVGYFLVFKISQNQIRKEVKREIKMKLNESELHKIVFNKSELNTINWIKTDKEFIHHNELFDIVRATETETTITYYCINDKQEKQLFANLDEHVNKHISNTKSSKKNTSKLIDNNHKILPSALIELINYYTIINHQTAYNTMLVSTNIASLTPPPDFS
jgi:hypothetical protein